MIGKEIDQITEDDLNKLIESEVIEQKTLEYKLKYSVGSPGDKYEFLADVSSFANASGGDIIYGIRSDNETGLPKEIKGLKIENSDAETDKLRNIIRTGIEPKIPHVTVQSVDLSNSKKALIIRVQKSWISPHGVKKESHYKFYSRHSNGKFSMDITELRSSFVLAESIIDKIRRFRNNRIANIVADETPVYLRNDSKFILHLIPLISFIPGHVYDIESIANNHDTNNLLDGQTSHKNITLMVILTIQ